MPYKTPSARATCLRLTLACATAASALGCLAGCGGTRTVYAPAAGPVRLAEDAHARVYVRDPQTGQWVKGSNRVTIPEGFYCVPPPTTRPAR